VSHELFVTHVEERLEAERIGISNQKFAVTNNGQQLFGLMQLDVAEARGRQYGRVLGLRNSYDRSFPAGLCVGAIVFVCDNLGFYGSHLNVQAHERGIMPSGVLTMISDAVSKIPSLFTSHSAALALYQRTPISDAQARGLTGRFFDRGGLNVVEIPKLLREWQAPRQREFAQAPKTAWRLLNAATEVLKSDLWRLPEKTFAIHQVLDEVCASNTTPAPGNYGIGEFPHEEAISVCDVL
jgi:hypothetical protein